MQTLQETTQKARPYRNPDCPEKKRTEYLNKQVILEIARMEEIARKTGAKSNREILRDYLAETKPEHLVTYLIATEALLGVKYNGLPKGSKEQLQFEHARDQICTILGQLTDRTKSVAVARELRIIPKTGDIENILYNATKKEQLNTVVIITAKTNGTRKRRIDRRVENVGRPLSMRKRLLRDEQKEDAGEGIF